VGLSEWSKIKRRLNCARAFSPTGTRGNLELLAVSTNSCAGIIFTRLMDFSAQWVPWVGGCPAGRIWLYYVIGEGTACCAQGF
jgi:hypothetical protein